ncbi:MAG: hypothetical protein HW388_852 [Dehalococcoidia bacterium]|nr:hypothetical protein [Dehalococcoidia bacterium]
MADKLCAKCGALNVANASSCSACGAQELREGSFLRLSMGRVVLLSVLASGLYFFYWLYLTWKHLQSETREVHHPFWHALTLFVPVYGLFRLHKHVRVIQGLALGVGVETSLAPGLAVVLVALNMVLGLGSTRVESLTGLLLLNIISLALTTTVIAWSQDGLNRYWSRARGTALRDASMRAGERVIILVGIALWINVLWTYLSA